MNNPLVALTPMLGKEVDACAVEEGLVTFVNLYSYARIRRHDHLLSAFSKVGIDGISLVLLVRALLGLRLERISFDMTSLAPVVFRGLENENKSVFLIGARSEEMDVARARLLEAFPKLRIAGVRSGYFDGEGDRAASIQQIIRLNPYTVVAGMGTPLQEQYLVDLWQAGWRGAGYTCGGFFHQIARKLAYYPPWMDRFHLRWAYRIWDEPRLLRRYGIDYPFAAVSFACDAARLKCHRAK